MEPMTLTFTQQQLQVLNDALVALPFKVAAPLIQHINAQIQRQHDAVVDTRDMPSGQMLTPN